jgi:vacuolar-type H+-ATPase subunit H
MFQEAINILLEAEVSAKLMLDEAAARAETQIEDARQTGTAKVAAATENAESEVAGLMRAVREKAQESASGLVSNMENKKAAIGARAEITMHKAAALIVERIVND